MKIGGVYGGKRRTKVRIGAGTAVGAVPTEDVGHNGGEVATNERSGRIS